MAASGVVFSDKIYFLGLFEFHRATTSNVVSPHQGGEHMQLDRWEGHRLIAHVANCGWRDGRNKSNGMIFLSSGAAATKKRGPYNGPDFGPAY